MPLRLRIGQEDSCRPRGHPFTSRLSRLSYQGQPLSSFLGGEPCLSEIYWLSHTVSSLLWGYVRWRVECGYGGRLYGDALAERFRSQGFYVSAPSKHFPADLVQAGHCPS